MEIDKKVSEYCRLVGEINKQNEWLSARRGSFYNGGYTFEEVYQNDIREIDELENRLISLLKEIIL